jgi:hypothetical protein
MIAPEDLNPKNFPETSNQKSNLYILAEKLSKLENIFGSLFKITSGLRSMEDQFRIYAERGITDPTKIPVHSQHLLGNAADIYDPHKTLQEFLLSEKGLIVLEDLGLYCEDFSCTPNWTHLQNAAPASKKRFFLP